MRSDERRRHVRIRPLPELPALLTLKDQPQKVLEIYDVSMGGLGLTTHPSLREAQRDDRLELRLDLGRYGAFELVARVCHVGATLTGTEIEEPPSGWSSAIGRYLAELLERGALS